MPVIARMPGFLTRHIAPVLATIAVLAATGLASAAAVADDYIKRVNDLYKTIPADKNAATILFPVLAKMQEPPKVLIDAKRAAIVLATHSDWAAIKEWIDAQPQRDMITAVKKVTDEESWKKAYAISIPYGADAAEQIDPKLVIDKMYIDLGEPATLAQANFLYLPRLTWVEMLMHAEANRLASEGKPKEAMDQLVRLCWIGRMMADREFQQEKAWGMNCVILSLMRIRDIAYLDSKKDQSDLQAEDLRAVIQRLKRVGGMLGIDRLQPPVGNQIAAEQLVAQVMVPSQGPDPERWSRLLAKALTKDRPLRIFSEAAKWEGVRQLHAKTEETAKMVERVYSDFNARWKLDPYDQRLKTPSDYAKLDRAKFALVDSTVSDVELVMTQRIIAAVEAASTRMSLGAYAYKLQNRVLPVSLASSRPNIITEVDLDPFDPERRRQVGYVPASEGDINITVFPELLGLRTPQFQVKVFKGEFIVYTGGPDGLDNGGRRFTQTMSDEKGDYLAWPPVISLVRKNLEDTGSLK